MLEEPPIYRRNSAVAVEAFGERSLALQCDNLRLVELNATARELLAHLDEPVSLAQVAAAMAVDYRQPEDELLKDIHHIVAQMVELGLVEQIV